jgi:hypothetical protein
MPGRKIRRSSKLRDRAEAALRGGGLGLPHDPAAEAAVKVYEQVYDEAVADGETEDAAYEKGMRAAVDSYLNTPPEGVYGESP